MLSETRSHNIRYEHNIMYMPKFFYKHHQLSRSLFDLPMSMTMVMIIIKNVFKKIDIYLI